MNAPTATAAILAQIIPTDGVTNSLSSIAVPLEDEYDGKQVLMEVWQVMVEGKMGNFLFFFGMSALENGMRADVLCLVTGVTNMRYDVTRNNRIRTTRVLNVFTSVLMHLIN